MKLAHAGKPIPLPPWLAKMIEGLHTCRADGCERLIGRSESGLCRHCVKKRAYNPVS
jgi:ribosomal protein S14